MCLFTSAIFLILRIIVAAIINNIDKLFYNNKTNIKYLGSQYFTQNVCRNFILNQLTIFFCVKNNKKKCRVFYLTMEGVPLALTGTDMTSSNLFILEFLGGL